MLDLHAGKTCLLRVSSRIVARMHITYDKFRLHLKQFLHPCDSLSHRAHAAKIRKVADIRRGIIELVFRKAERVFKLAADCQHRSPEMAWSGERERRIAARSPHHIRFPERPLHDGIVGAKENVAVI